MLKAGLRGLVENDQYTWIKQYIALTRGLRVAVRFVERR